MIKKQKSADNSFDHCICEGLYLIKRACLTIQLQSSSQSNLINLISCHNYDKWVIRNAIIFQSMMPDLGYIISLILGVCVAIVLLLPKKQNHTLAKPSTTFDGQKATIKKEDEVCHSNIILPFKCENALDKGNELQKRKVFDETSKIAEKYLSSIDEYPEIEDLEHQDYRFKLIPVPLTPAYQQRYYNHRLKKIKHHYGHIISMLNSKIQEVLAKNNITMSGNMAIQRETLGDLLGSLERSKGEANAQYLAALRSQLQIYENELTDILNDEILLKERLKKAEKEHEELTTHLYKSQLSTNGENRKSSCEENRCQRQTIDQLLITKLKSMGQHKGMLFQCRFLNEISKCLVLSTIKKSTRQVVKRTELICSYEIQKRQIHLNEIIGTNQTLLFLFNCKQKNLAVFSKYFCNSSTLMSSQAFAIDFQTRQVYQGSLHNSNDFKDSTFFSQHLTITLVKAACFFNSKSQSQISASLNWNLKEKYEICECQVYKIYNHE